MVVSSFYTVFVTANMEKMLKRFSKTGSLKVQHHFETKEFDYYVMSDNSGNNTDFIQFKNIEMKDGFYAVRMNTDNFEQMAAILYDNEFEIEGKIEDNQHVKLAKFVSKNNEPSILLFEHKK